DPRIRRWRAYRLRRFPGLVPACGRLRDHGGFLLDRRVDPPGEEIAGERMQLAVEPVSLRGEGPQLLGRLRWTVRVLAGGLVRSRRPAERMVEDREQVVEALGRPDIGEALAQGRLRAFE